MNLKQVFMAIGSHMLVDFDHFQSQISHPGEKGSEREIGLKSFLQTYLPERYGISNGEIVDTSNHANRQCDLIIYDRLNCPLLLAGKEYRIFPAEPVYAVVEVKSVLTAGELKDATEKISVVKNLARENGVIAGIIFAYRSSWKKNSVQQGASHLQRINAKLHPKQYTDLVYILDTGLIELYPLYTEEDNRMQVLFDLEVPVLLWFYIRLLDLLSGKVSANPDYENYLDLVLKQ